MEETDVKSIKDIWINKEEYATVSTIPERFLIFQKINNHSANDWQL